MGVTFAVELLCLHLLAKLASTRPVWLTCGWIRLLELTLFFLCHPNDFFGFSDHQPILLCWFQMSSLLLESLCRVVSVAFGVVGLMTSLVTIYCTPLRPIGRDVVGPAVRADRGQQLSRFRTGREICTA